MQYLSRVCFVIYGWELRGRVGQLKIYLFQVSREAHIRMMLLDDLFKLNPFEYSWTRESLNSKYHYQQNMARAL